MYIIKNSRTDFEICLPKKSSCVREAADILANYIEKITGCRLAFTDVTGSACVKNKIVLDIEPFVIPLEHSDNLENEGFVIAEKDGAVYIYGAKSEALVYGVYEFLEEYCGCLWLTSSDDYVPKNDRIAIPDNTFNKQLPALNYREVYYYDAWDYDFARKQKINGQASVIKNGKLEEGHKNWGFWCHSFFNLVPPDEYFETHPEFYSLIDGQRVRDGQLCCTNDEMIEIAIKNLKKFMDAKPEAIYWSVSQNDTTRQCQCEKCRALDEKAGSPIGSIMYFVNKVAEAFPDKIISTLSYWYSRTAPVEIEMRDNVHIMFCNIECNRSRPIQYDPSSESFVRDINIWRKYCGNIFLWDYDIQFSNLISPFPNLRVLAPNMRFFYESNVRSIFNQANRDKKGEFWALRGYMLAKLSWNPYCDIEKHMNNFISAYYGKAAPYVHKYIDLLHDEMEKSGENLSIFGQPADEKFLSEELLDKYEEILGEGKKAVDGDDVLTLRVDEIILGVVYARLKSKRYKNETEREEYKAYFRRIADAIGLEKVEEWTQTVDMFLNDN